MPAATGERASLGRGPAPSGRPLQRRQQIVRRARARPVKQARPAVTAHKAAMSASVGADAGPTRVCTSGFTRGT